MESKRKIYELPISENYVGDWGTEEAVREIMQNAIDSEADGNEMEISYNSGTLRESLKMMREIVYDMTSYWSDDNKGVVYNGEYSKDHIWQATMLGNGLRALADVFNQSIVDKREYDKDYFKKWDLNYLQAALGWKDEEISELKKELTELRDSIEER